MRRMSISMVNVGIAVRDLEAAIAFISETHPDVVIHVGLVDKAVDGKPAVMPGMGDIADRLFGTSSEDAVPIGEDGMDDS